MSFSGKVAIVTGAGQGIGMEICRVLADAGATVILNDIDQELAENAAKKISTNNNCFPFVGDSSDKSVIEQIVSTTVMKFGKLDIAIANAGITLFGDFFEYSVDSFERVMDVNLRGTFFLAQAAAKQMKEQKSGGSLLFTSSVTGHQAHKDLAAYGMSKAAIEMLARNLVIELSKFGINVNTIAPGATMTERTMSTEGDYEANWKKLTPMGRPATVTDIA
ncbi:MAG TPA: SDR family oxidoreductase, partial [Chitinophagaceae bacterium]|nr:SDR family oxidoreductase [Chitinophagaceae bacterium]